MHSCLFVFSSRSDGEFFQCSARSTLAVPKRILHTAGHRSFRLNLHPSNRAIARRYACRARGWEAKVGGDGDRRMERYDSYSNVACSSYSMGEPHSTFTFSTIRARLCTPPSPMGNPEWRSKDTARHAAGRSAIDVRKVDLELHLLQRIYLHVLVHCSHVLNQLRPGRWFAV